MLATSADAGSLMQPTTTTTSGVSTKLKKHGDIQSLVLSCNKDGMDSLRRGFLKPGFEQLKYAEAILIANQKEGENSSLLAITCNNLGCYYKKTGKLHAALSYLRRALKIEVALNTNDVTVAGTHINICSILSKLEKHDKAAQHALCALELISRKVSLNDGTVTQDDYSVLAIAYHNVAVEREYLKQWDQAAVAYRQGYQVAKRCLGEEHPLAQTLGKNCDAVLLKSSKGKGSAAKLVADIASGTATALPQLIASGGAGGGDVSGMPMPISPGATGGMAAIKDAQEWVDSEQNAWTEFSKQTLMTGRAVPTTLPPPPGISASGMDPGFVTAEGGQPIQPRPPAAGGVLGGGTDDPPQPGFAPPLPPLSPTSGDTKDFAGGFGSAYSSPARPAGAVAPLELLPEFAMGSPPEALTALERLRDLEPLLEGGDPKLPKLQQDAAKKGVRGGQLRPAEAEGAEAEDEDQLAERDVQHSRSPLRSAANDFRPNRTINGATRTSLALRRTGMFNETTFRDQIIAKRKGQVGGFGQSPWKSQFVQKSAAERIQRVWRSWHRYCRDHHDWIMTTRICATLIQARWRCYFVQRLKLDMAAKVIQRHIRGYLVRLVLKRHTAAVTIQRHVVGMLTRHQLKRLHVSACHVQRLVRGGLSRAYVVQKRKLLTGAVVVLQRCCRALIGRRLARERRKQQNDERVLRGGAVNIQRFYRGNRGRAKVALRREEWHQEQARHVAAQRLQAMARRDNATKKVKNLRKEKMDTMSHAATFLRKLWLGFITRKRYMELKKEFENHIDAILTIQRYVRGYIVRLRMWREAIQAEEELHAALEIQRIYRGYIGRVHWENRYEEYWAREVAAAWIQRRVRGWLARVRVTRTRRRIARTEFEMARRRFRAAQRLQAVWRGKILRRAIQIWKAEIILCVTRLQKVFRGHRLRRMLWEEVTTQRATKISSHVRGFLVRNRYFRLIATVIMIQRKLRFHLSRNPKVRARHRMNMVKRRDGATSIQSNYRARRDRKLVENKKAEAKRAEDKKSEPQRKEATSIFLKEFLLGKGMTVY